MPRDYLGRRSASYAMTQDLPAFQRLHDESLSTLPNFTTDLYSCDEARRAGKTSVAIALLLNCLNFPL